MMCITLPSLSKDSCCPDLKIFLVELYLSKKQELNPMFWSTQS